MSETIICAEEVGKEYRIIHEANRAQGLRHVLHVWFARPLRRATKRLSGVAVENGASSKPQSAEREAFWALRGVSFEIKRGDVVGIRGRNGAAKSTLLKILSRIAQPSTGR